MALVPLLSKGVGYKSRTVSLQHRINLYCEINADPDKDQIAMYPTPGSDFTNATGFEVRGAVTVGNIAYVLCGTILFKHDPVAHQLGVFCSLPMLTTSRGRVGMACNGAQVMIVDGVGGYIVTIAVASPNKITDANFPNGATTVTFLAGYFIVEKPNTGQFWWSNIYNGFVWNGLQFATAESNPDNLVAVAADHGILLLFGERTLEFWGPSGTTSIFQRIGAAGVEWGLAAKYSYDRFSDNAIFLAQNRMGQFQVVVLKGMQVEEVNSPDIIAEMNRLIQENGLGSLQNVSGFTYMLDGHPMYEINFPQKSFLYDGKSDCWSELQTFNLFTQQFDRHFANIHWVILGDSYCSDYRDTLPTTDPSYGHLGWVSKLNPTTYTDQASAQIVREWGTKHVFADLNRLTIKEFFIECQAATALVPPGVTTFPPGAPGKRKDPQWSKDGGATWGNEIWQPMGLLGNYLTRCVWRALGRARDFVFRMRITDPVKVVIVNAGMDVG
jgi:hypothetical protein